MTLRHFHWSFLHLVVILCPSWKVETWECVGCGAKNTFCVTLRSIMKWPVSWNCNNTAGPEHFGIWWRRNGQSQNSFKYLCKYADNRLRGIFSRIRTFECCVRVWEKIKRFVKIDVMSWRVKFSAAINLPRFTTSDENAFYQPTQSMSSSVYDPPSLCCLHGQDSL